MENLAASNILLVPLFRGLTLTTKDQANSKSYLDLDIKAVRHLLPRCTALFLVGSVENVAAAEFAFNMGFFSGFHRDHQPASAVDIAAQAITSSNLQGTRSADYTVVGNFLLDSRLQLSWWNPTSNIARPGLCSGVLGCKLSTG